ncbi:MAG: DUF4968 domain-containing protein [Clostridia bacterium]|nr:DUF4968 domain-containing protein [Clostridia bacterium]
MLEVYKKPRDRIVSFERKNDALHIATERGQLLIEPQTERIMRIRYTRREAFSDRTGIGIMHNASFPQWTLEEEDDCVRLKTASLCLFISKSDAAIRYQLPDGTLLLQEREKDPRELESFSSYKLADEAEAVIEEVSTADGVKKVVREAEKIFDKELYHTRLHLHFQKNEHLYGLGQAEEGLLDLRGSTQYIHQANRKIGVPFLLSTCGYGILLATGSPAVFEDTQYGSYLYTEADVEMDYYFIAGATFDALIRSYHLLTGKAAMLPAWAFGFMQSQERYETQQEMLDVAREYRRRGLGLDLIVLDWRSWVGDLWGQKTMDPDRFPDLQGLTDSLHKDDIRMMVSIWPNMSTDCDNYKEFKEKGMLLPAADVYDAFREDARQVYWRQAEEGIFSYGTDAWWCDSSEPFTPEWSRKERPEPGEQYREFVEQASLHMPAEAANAYGLVHAQGIYEGQRASGSAKRVVNLTRNGYTGGQRYGTILWSGDTEATWETFRKQIPAGLNLCAAGLPYWTLDIGAFFVKRGMPWFWSGDYEAGMEDLGYQELFTRWFQYGAFLPIFRSHGTDVRREMWAVTHPEFYNALVRANRLRYQLLPYIYSSAASVWLNDDTMLRLLAFDYPKDHKACAIKDQYLFGPNVMVCPITEPMYFEADSRPLQKPKTRKVYLPEGSDWFDFYTNERYEGGQTIVVNAPIDRIPLFIKAGSILPMTKAAACAREALSGDIVLKVYPGKDALFTLYEDAGDSYEYETGAYTTTTFVWNDTEKQTYAEPSVTPRAWRDEPTRQIRWEIIGE